MGADGTRVWQPRAMALAQPGLNVSSVRVDLWGPGLEDSEAQRPGPTVGEFQRDSTSSSDSDSNSYGVGSHLKMQAAMDFLTKG